MSALGQFKDDVFSEEKSGSLDVEAARKELGTSTSQSPLQSEDESALPPVDGGIKAWSVIGGAFLALFVQFGLGEFESSPDSSASTTHIWIALYYVLLLTSRGYSWHH